MSIKAMKQALNALESIWVYGADTLSGPVKGQLDDRKFQRDGVAEMTKRARLGKEALRQAIEAAEKQEPVTWFDSNACEGDENQVCGVKTKRHTTPLYTHPPKREWVGLTAKDLSQIPPSAFEGAIWADAKLKEKNG